MRILFALLALMALAACVSGRFRVGEADDALVIIGVAEAHDATESRYAMLWRRYHADTGRFVSYDDDAVFEAETNADDTLRIAGLPGEFTVVRVRPGAYALDSVFGRLRDGRLTYIAPGVIYGPERPAFEVRPGEAVYLGIWQTSVDTGSAEARLWRLDQRDLQQVVAAARATRGQVVLRETQTRAVACNVRWMNSYSQRQVC